MAVVIILMSVGPSQAAPSADEIAVRASEKLREIQTIQADVAADYSDPSGKAPIKMTVRVSADRVSKLTRMEITEHQVLEGQIIILDMKKDQATVYMPVTGQAYRGKTQSIAAQLGLDMGTLDLDHLLSLDPAGVMVFKYVRQDKIDRLPYHVIETRSKDEQTGYQLVWVDCETYMVRKVEVYDSQGKRIAAVAINNLKLNAKLDANKLRELPKGTRITDIK
ncbi:MAG: outer membrane lipoprotein-sorting protein [Clostridia bacterium]|nr:outer membrane lipoprotein-sorting protein [Clostridia bacterium]